MTDFNKNSILFDKANNPLPPDKSTQVKIFHDGNEFKTLGFDGAVKPLVGKQEVSYVPAQVNVEADLVQISIPNPLKIAETLKGVIDGNKTLAQADHAKVLSFIELLKVSQLENQQSVDELMNLVKNISSDSTLFTDLLVKLQDQVYKLVPKNYMTTNSIIDCGEII